MRRDLIIADDFYADPRAVVRYAYSQEFLAPYSGPAAPADQPVAWRSSRYRSARDCPFKSSEGLLARLEFLTGEPVDREHWNLDFPVGDDGYPRREFRELRRSCWWNCAFHVKHHPQALGEGVHNHTEADEWNAVGEDGWVGLIYLNEDAPSDAGLHTWRNRDLRHQYDWMTAPENWIHVDELGNVFNRLVLHRGRIPHSGAAGWGTQLADGRLYQTIFFRSAAMVAAAPLSLQELGL